MIGQSAAGKIGEHRRDSINGEHVPELRIRKPEHFEHRRAEEAGDKKRQTKNELARNNE